MTANLHFPQILENPQMVQQYAVAGNSTFTLKSLATGQHYTFRVRAPERKEGQPEPQIRFVAAMHGSDNENSFKYLGTIYPEGNYSHGRKSSISQDAPSAKAFRWFWAHVRADVMPPKCEVMRSNTCCRCGRKLTNPESILSGIGPECAEKIGGYTVGVDHVSSENREIQERVAASNLGG